MAAMHELQSPRRFGSPIAPAGGRPSHFVMTCHTQQAYLRLADQSGGQIRLLKMKPRGKQGRWGLILTLRPGTYRYRYYADHRHLGKDASPGAAGDLPVRLHAHNAVLHIRADEAPETEAPVPPKFATDVRRMSHAPMHSHVVNGTTGGRHACTAITS